MQAARFALLSLSPLLAWLVVLAPGAALAAVTIVPGPKSGYPLANFSLAGELATSGQFPARVLYNPPVYGQWLQPLGSGQLVIRDLDSGVALTDRAFAERTLSRAWPFADCVYRDQRIFGLEARLSAFAPAGLDDVATTSLPAILAELVLRNNGAAGKHLEVALEFDPEAAFEGDSYAIHATSGFYALRSARLGIAFDRPAGYTPPSAPEDLLRLTRRVVVAAGGEVAVRLLLLLYLDNGYAAAQHASWNAMAAHCFARWDALRAATADIDRRMPSLGDAALDSYTRWYAMAGVSLTKTLRDGTMLTMGYTELNQRDSFWSSWIHLLLWPSADRAMLRVSAAHQRADGKIPTTILPIIEREDDIDINEYFVLRAFRHVEWTRDAALLAELWPAIKKAINYLGNRDVNGDRVPDTVDNSYWADWKDVYSYLHRKYGAHFCLLWLAVLEKAVRHAEAVNDGATKATYQSWLTQARAKIDAPRSGEHGGLWTGTQYGNIWKGGLFYPDNRVLEDQAVGGVFDVLDPGRARSIFDALAANERPWGVRETFPYYPTNFLPDPGDYHNGAVWPWLNFADAFARYRYGYPAEAERIIKAVGYYDLVHFGDYLPHENLHGETGQNRRHEIQAWNAALVGTVAFAALGLERTGADTLRLYPRVDPARTLRALLTLPEGTIEWAQTARGANVHVSMTSRLNRTIEIRYGLRIPAGHWRAGTGTLRIGDCEYVERVATLTPNQPWTASLDEESTISVW